MTDEKAIVRPATNPFDLPESHDDEKSSPKMSFPDVMKKEESPAAKKDTSRNVSAEKAGTIEVPRLAHEPATSAEKPKATKDAVERVKEAAPAPSAPDFQSIDRVQDIYKKIKTAETALSEYYTKKPDGNFEVNAEKVSTETGRAQFEKLLKDVAAEHKKAIAIADEAMKDPQAILGKAIAVREEYNRQAAQTKSLVDQLKKTGLDPEPLEAGYLGRYIAQEKNPEIKAKLTELKTLVEKQDESIEQFRDLKVLSDLPLITRQAQARFIHQTGKPNEFKAAVDDLNAVAERLQNPARHSDSFKEIKKEAEQARDNSLSEKIREDYLKNPDNPLALLESGLAKAKANDIEGAQKDLEQARTSAKKLDRAEIEKDIAVLKTEMQNFSGDKNSEAYLKMVHEGQILDALLLSKPMADMQYADFLLNKPGSNENDRRFARDIMLSLRFDEYGKITAELNKEQFGKNMEKALNGSKESNEKLLLKFREKMNEYEELIKQASTQKTDADVARVLDDARRKAENAKEFAEKIDRDAARENEQRVRENVSKLIADENAKPADQRDNGKIKLLNEVLKPADQKDPKIVDLLVNLMKPASVDAAKRDQLMKMVKDPSSIYDALGAMQIIEASQFQQQAANQARLKMLELDIHRNKGENNPLIKDIENDGVYGKEFIAMLQKVPGHDGRTAWGDLKEATRDLAWYETAYKWITGPLKNVALALKDITISLVSGVVGTAAGVFVGGLTSWTGPGAVIAGAGAGFLAGAGTSALLHKLCGDDVTVTNTLVDGLGGATGGVFGVTSKGLQTVGKVTITRVASQEGAKSFLESRTATTLAELAAKPAITAAEKGLAEQALLKASTLTTREAIRFAGAADKLRLAFSASRVVWATGASAGTYYYSNQFLSGDYKNTSDWLRGNSIPSDKPQGMLRPHRTELNSWIWDNAISPTSKFLGIKDDTK